MLSFIHNQILKGEFKMLYIINEEGKKYIWNYRRLLKHIFIILWITFLIWSYLYVGNLDYLTLIGK